MKKTIASLAFLVVSTGAHAIIGPNPGVVAPKLNNYCLKTYEANDGSAYVSDCDSSARNKQLHLTLNANGCADGQVSLQSTTVKIKTCPTFVQL